MPQAVWLLHTICFSTLIRIKIPLFYPYAQR